MEEIIKQNSNIIIENRKKINVSGVKECLNFDDETIILQTTLGNLTIKGEKLHILNFDTKTGDLSVEGDFCAMAYTVASSGSFFSKLFK